VIFEGFAALSEGFGYVLSGFVLGTVVGAFAGFLRMWRK